MNFEGLVSEVPTSTHNLGVVINAGYGGFRLTPKALKIISDVEGEKDLLFWDKEKNRTNRTLVKTFQLLGEESGHKLKIYYIPEEYENYFEISEYDGWEGIRVFPERHLLNEVASLTEEDIAKVGDESVRQKLEKIKKLSVEFTEMNTRKRDRR